MCGSKKKDGAAGKRIHFLDTIRGFLVIIMVIYHVLFDLVWVFGVERAEPFFDFLSSFSIVFTAAFVLMAGVTARFSRNPAAHGARLLMIAAVFTLVTAFVFPGQAIYFGVLHLISVSMLAFSVVGKALDRLPWWLTAALFAALFTMTYHVGDGYFGVKALCSAAVPEALTVNNLLVCFGFTRANFSSVDYLPLLPWAFAYMAGTSIGRMFTRGELPEKLYKDPCPPLSVLGRYSLAIYVLHQPLAFVVLWLIYR